MSLVELKDYIRPGGGGDGDGGRGGGGGGEPPLKLSLQVPDLLPPPPPLLLLPVEGGVVEAGAKLWPYSPIWLWEIY